MCYFFTISTISRFSFSSFIFIWVDFLSDSSWFSVMWRLVLILTINISSRSILPSISSIFRTRESLCQPPSDFMSYHIWYTHIVYIKSILVFNAFYEMMWGNGLVGGLVNFGGFTLVLFHQSGKSFTCSVLDQSV